MQSLRGILNFVRVAQLGSFAKAGQELGISSVAVSKNISRLEASLGVRLFARSTRQLQLTPEGMSFLEQCRTPLSQLDQACQQVKTEAQHPQGLVKVTLVSPTAYLYVLPQLPRFLKQYPQIDVQLELSENIDALIARKFDIGIRMGTLDDAAFVARPLGPLRLLLCASPQYLKKHGTPQTIDELAHYKAVQLQVSGQDQPSPWVFWQAETKKGQNQGAVGARTMQPNARFICNDYRSLLEACMQGVGIAQLPQPLVMRALERGQLKLLLPSHVVPGLQLFVHYPSRKHVPARVKAFVDFVVQGLGRHPDLMIDPLKL